MGKSLRSKREKRLKAIRRDLVEKEPFYVKKEAAKLAAQQAALEAPKLPVRATSNDANSNSMIIAGVYANIASQTQNNNNPNDNMDVEMSGGSQNMSYPNPVGGVAKKSKRKFKVGKGKSRGKIKRKYI